MIVVAQIVRVYRNVLFAPSDLLFQRVRLALKYSKEGTSALTAAQFNRTVCNVRSLQWSNIQYIDEGRGILLCKLLDADVRYFWRDKHWKWWKSVWFAEASMSRWREDGRPPCVTPALVTCVDCVAFNDSVLTWCCAVVPVVFDSGRCNLPHGHQFSTAPSRGRKRAELIPTEVLVSYLWLVLSPFLLCQLSIYLLTHWNPPPPLPLIPPFKGSPCFFRINAKTHARPINVGISVNMSSMCLVSEPDFIFSSVQKLIRDEQSGSVKVLCDHFKICHPANKCCCLHQYFSRLLQWMYIVPLVLFLMMSGAQDQSGGGAGGGAGSGGGRWSTPHL